MYVCGFLTAGAAIVLLVEDELDVDEEVDGAGCVFSFEPPANAEKAAIRSIAVIIR